MRILVIFSAFVSLCKADDPEYNTHWTNVTQYTALLVKTLPDGLLDGVHDLYTCQMWADNRWMIGSFVFIGDTIVSDCTVVTWGKLFQTNKFHVLLYAPGSTSWLPSTGKYPEKGVIGGVHRDGTPGYVCRATYGKSLLVGMSHNNGHSCYMPQAELERHVGDKNQIEILAENRYGTLFDKSVK